MKRILFWNTDTQKDFMNSDGALYIQGAEKIKPNLKLLTDFAERKFIQVINTGDLHKLEDVEISMAPDYKITFPQHCFEGTPGAEFIAETNPEGVSIYLYEHEEYYDSLKIADTSVRNILLYKNSCDIFSSNEHAEEFLKLIHPDVVIVYGVTTEYCVNYAVKGLLKRNYAVRVVKDAIKELPETDVNKIFNKWLKLGAKLCVTKEVLNLSCL